MRKTSVYLTEADRERLRRLADGTGRPQAEVIRMALAEYEAAHLRSGDFALFAVEGARSADGRSVADIPEEELLEGFGE